jgi:hypothetical protein
MLEHYLTRRRKEIDRKYDYLYSQLTRVFGRLLHEDRLSEDRSARLTRGQAEVDPFCRQIPCTGRSVTRILSAIAWFQQLLRFHIVE